MNHFSLYTDGSCKGGTGSWAFVLQKRDLVIQENSRQVRKTNSNRMEIQAVIEGLQQTALGSSVEIFTDFRLLIENAADFPKWASAGWRKKHQPKIPNSDLFRILYELILGRTVTWKWVRAHSGNMYNERCDLLCLIAREVRS